MRRLRQIKQEAALVIALADLSKVWDTLQATHALTRIADATLSAAVAFTLREAAARRQARTRRPRAIPNAAVAGFFWAWASSGALS